MASRSVQFSRCGIGQHSGPSSAVPIPAEGDVVSPGRVVPVMKPRKKTREYSCGPGLKNQQMDTRPLLSVTDNKIWVQVALVFHNQPPETAKKTCRSNRYIEIGTQGH